MLGEFWSAVSLLIAVIHDLKMCWVAELLGVVLLMGSNQTGRSRIGRWLAGWMDVMSIFGILSQNPHFTMTTKYLHIACKVLQTDSNVMGNDHKETCR